MSPEVRRHLPKELIGFGNGLVVELKPPGKQRRQPGWRQKPEKTRRGGGGVKEQKPTPRHRRNTRVGHA